jgi:hypothetical protein
MFDYIKHMHAIAVAMFHLPPRPAQSVEVPSYVFCEPEWASPKSCWHIRRVMPNVGLKLGGGIDTPSLCGRVLTHKGWDLNVEITRFHLTHNTCIQCRDTYEQEQCEQR